MKLTRICSEFSYGNWVIHKFGYDEFGQRVHRTDEFRDYFYFLEENLEELEPFEKVYVADDNVYNGLYGENTRKIGYTSIKQRNLIRDSFEDSTFELDVKAEFKYMMNRDFKYEWAEAKDRHILYFDIETWTDKDEFAPPGDPFAWITSIQGYSSKLEKYFMFTWHQEETKDIEEPLIHEVGDKVYVFCKNEWQVLASFFGFLEDYEVDLLTGWYSEQFDMPYIINRAQRINMDPSVMSPIGKIQCYEKEKFGNPEWRTYISGLDHIDMLQAINDKLNYNLPNNKLETAAKVILKGRNIEKLSDVTWKDWPTDFIGFMKYGMRDVEILKEIDETLGLFDYYCMVQNLSNITQLSDINSNTAVVDRYILSECRDEYVFPTQKGHDRVKYMGAEVLTPIPGLYEDVGVVDYASLYPTSIMSFNLSPETYICSKDSASIAGVDIQEVSDALREEGVGFVDTGEDAELFGERYLFYGHTHKVGLLPKILKKMYLERKAIKKKMWDHDKESSQYAALDKRQYAIKIILNSAYGAFGFNYFRLYKPEVADAITFFARRALHFAIDNLVEDDHEIVYGDTDSVFFVQNGKTDVELNCWVDRFNSSLSNKFIPTYNTGVINDFRMMELEYEKSLEMIYFGADRKIKKDINGNNVKDENGKNVKEIIGKKKRYYGIEVGGKKYVKGMKIIRKDAPNFIKEHLDILSEHAVRKTLTVEMLLDLRGSLVDVPLIDIGVQTKYGMPFNAYKVKTQALKGAWFANERLGMNITHKDIPYMFYIVSKCEDDLKKPQRTKALCLLEENLDVIGTKDNLFELDLDTFFQKQILDQLMEFEFVGHVLDILSNYKKAIKERNRNE